MTAEWLLLTFLLLQVKHLFADYIWQSGWMVMNKGKYGHPGGLAHAALHAVLTLAVLVLLGVDPVWALVVSVGEFVLHYHIDWLKDQVIRRRNPSPKQREYWIYTGLDQFGHQATLIAVVAALLWFS